MSRITSARPSPAMVIAVIALSLSVVGSSVAATGTLDRAIKKSKVRTIAKKQANKVLNQREASLNVASARNGVRAIAYVNADGTLVGSRSQGLGGASINKAGTGAYCFGDLPFEPRAAVVSQRTFSFGGEVDAGIPPDTVGICPASHSDFRVQTYNSAGAVTDRAFAVIFF